MSRHEGVSCDACLKANFRGRRYKCLVCYDYDLCASCHEEGVTTTRHTTEHAMQCILTRMDFELYYGGEGVSFEQPQSLTCPYCGKHGFTESTLMEHATAEHSDGVTEVVCPICASLPGGEPNYVTDDFAAHITFEHRGVGSSNGARSNSSIPIDLDDGSGTINITSGPPSIPGERSSGIRRMQYRGRGLGRAVPRRNLTFGNMNPTIFQNSRESMDPIAELLSQLTGTRRSNTASRQLSSQSSQPLSTGSTSQNQWSEAVESRRSVRRNMVAGASNLHSLSTSMANSAASSIAAQIAQAQAMSATGTQASSSTANSGVPNPRLLYGSLLSSSGGTGETMKALGDTPTPSTISQTAAGGLFTPSLPQQQTTAANSLGQHSATSQQFLLSRLNESEQARESSAEGSELDIAFIREILVSSLSALSISPDSPSPPQTPSQEEPVEVRAEKVPTTTTTDTSTQTTPALPPPLNAKPAVPPAYKGGKKATVVRPTGAVTKARPTAQQNPPVRGVNNSQSNQGNFVGGGGGTGGGGSSSTSTVGGVSPPVNGGGHQPPRAIVGSRKSQANRSSGEVRAPNDPPPPH